MREDAEINRLGRLIGAEQINLDTWKKRQEEACDLLREGIRGEEAARKKIEDHGRRMNRLLTREERTMITTASPAGGR